MNFPFRHSMANAQFDENEYFNEEDQKIKSNIKAGVIKFSDLLVS